MNLIPDKIGADKKKLMWLGGLVALLAVVYFLEREPSSPTVTPATNGRTALPVARQPAVMPETSSGPRLATRTGKRADDFRPSIKLPEGIDVTKIDPRLKTELLAKLKLVPLAGGARSVFDFGSAPVPPPPKVAAIRPEVLLAQQKAREQAAVEMAKNPPKPVAPPIPLKFYGYANKLTGPARQAFFLDGEDIQIKAENDVIRGRYKIVRIGINSATVEDLQSHDQQTLPLVAELNT